MTTLWGWLLIIGGVLSLVMLQCQGSRSLSPLAETNNGSGEEPTIIECYGEGMVNFRLLDYDYSQLLLRVEGPIEICIDGQYESLCDIGWDDINALALCRSLVGVNAVAEPLYGLGVPQNRYASRTFNCSTYDYGLGNCQYTSDADLECNDGAHVAGVRCKQSCIDGQIIHRNSIFTYDNGLATYRGRVDVCINSSFLPICDLGWDNRDAQVICRRMYSRNFIGEVYRSFPLFPSSNYAAQEVMCNGTENSFSQCDYNPPTNPECFVGNHSAAVVCRQVCTEGSVRLVNQSYVSTLTGLPSTSGIVQVCINQTYGFVCADNWDDHEADVVCRSLSYLYRAPHYENTASMISPIHGDAPIYRYSMCTGTEYSFNRCQLPISDSNSTCPSIGIVNCTKVVSRCYSDGSFRLANVTRDSSRSVNGLTLTVTGRIEVCANSSHKSLCSHYWDQADAQVFCEYYLGHFYGRRLLGNITGHPALPSQYGYSSGGVAAYDVRCNGTEYVLEACDIDKTPDSDDFCQNPTTSAAGVVCTSTVLATPRPACTEFDLRTTNETYQTAQGLYAIFEANAEVCINEIYVAICDLGWDDAEAQLFCDALGLKEPYFRGIAVSGFTTIASIGVEDVVCPSGATSASECSATVPPRSQRCSSDSSAAGVRCIQVRKPCYRERDFTILNVTYENRLNQLFGGDLSITGRVGVCHDGIYGSVCDTNWDQEDADVICRQLYGSNFEATALTGHDIGADPVILETINCTGSEKHTSLCPISPIGVVTDHNCHEPRRAAGITCRLKTDTCIDGATRLVNGTAFYEGRLEVCKDNQWLAVCEKGFSTSVATRVCNQKLLLAGSITDLSYGSVYGSGTGPLLVACQEFPYQDFALVGNCSSSRPSNSTCNHETDVGLRCSKGQLDIKVVPKGRNSFGSSSFSLECSAQQHPWNTTLISGGWYDADGNQITNTSRGGPVSVDLLQNYNDHLLFNYTYTLRSWLHFNHPLSIIDAGYYYCTVLVEVTYPDNTKAELFNSTVYPLIIEILPPILSLRSNGTPFHNRPYTATCWVTFTEEAVPLDLVEINWLTIYGTDLTDISDRVKLSQIRQINSSTFSRDVIISPLKLGDTGSYACKAGVDGKFIKSLFAYETAQIHVLPPPPPPPDVRGLCSNVVWYSPDVSCDGVSGYDIRLYSPLSVHQNVTRQVGANGTFYIIKDEDKLLITDDTYFQVRIIYGSGLGEWSVGAPLGCKDLKPGIVPEITSRRVYFEMKGKIYFNNSALSMSEIGEGDKALYCKTDKEECCGASPNRYGQFYYPNGVQIPIARLQQGFYRDRGEQIIRLNRREGATSPYGKYQCEIPNADDEMVKIYITLTG